MASLHCSDLGDSAQRFTASKAEKLRNCFALVGLAEKSRQTPIELQLIKIVEIRTARLLATIFGQPPIRGQLTFKSMESLLPLMSRTLVIFAIPSPEHPLCHCFVPFNIVILFLFSLWFFKEQELISSKVFSASYFIHLIC
jgi:hypothetical protein